jgi:PEP-CTERM motif
VKKVAWALFAAVTLSAMGAAPAYAGSRGNGLLCNWFGIGCPTSPVGGGKTSVPEPETLTVLAVSACAAGIAARRRRGKK